MTWDPYGMPHAPSDRRRDGEHRYPPDGPSVSVRGVVAILAGMALLALVFTVAANAQQTTTEPATEQQQAQEQSTATGSMQAEPAEQAEVPAPVDGQIVDQPAGTFAASKLMGQSVYSPEGEAVGQISDLLLSEDNRLVGVVIGIGGFLGIGEKPIAVEVERLSRASTQDGGEQLILDYTRAELERAPEFVSLEQQRQQQARKEAERAAQQQGAAQQPAAEGQTQAQ